MFNSPLPLLALALAILILSTVFIFLRRRLLVRQMGAMRVVDASGLNIPPPAVLQPAVRALLDLGFQRLGEARIADAPPREGPVQVWYFFDREATTCAGVFAIRQTIADAVLYSWFGDEAVIVTGHPYGEFIEEPNYRFHTIRSSVADAYQHHLEQISDFALRYGAPRRLDSMAEVLRLDVLYNQKFAARRNRPAMRRELSTILFQFYLVGIVLAIYAGLRLFDLPLLVVLSGGALLMLLGLILYRRLRRRVHGG